MKRFHVVRTYQDACMNRIIYFDALTLRKPFFFVKKNRHFSSFSFKRPSCDHHSVLLNPKLLRPVHTLL